MLSSFEDPSYRGFFDRAEAELSRYRAGQAPARQAAERIFEIAGEHEFPVRIRVDAMRRASWMRPEGHMSKRHIKFAREGFRWALTNANSRDSCGLPNTLYRCSAGQPDPYGP